MQNCIVYVILFQYFKSKTIITYVPMVFDSQAMFPDDFEEVLLPDVAKAKVLSRPFGVN